MKYLLLLFSLFLLSACSQQESQNISSFVGAWTLISTSGGHSGGGFEANFSQLIVTEDYTFRLLNDSNSVIANGTFTEVDKADDRVHLEFSGESIVTTWTELVDDPEKMLEFENSGKMNLISPCCDRFNLHFQPQ